jgi:shikimate kinase
MNVILTGMRGTGKSSIGSALAERLAFRFVDTDEVIEGLAGQRIAEIVAQYGWAHFRNLERQAVAQCAAVDRQVIAVGGGTLMDEVNTEHLKAQGLVVLLLCDLSTLQRRIRGEDNRPSLTGQGSAVAELANVWEMRRARYHAVADITFDVSEETDDFTQDTLRKAAQVEALLQRHGFSVTQIEGR